VVDPEPDPAAARAEARDALKRIVAEAVLIQDFAEDILEGVRAQRPHAELAGPGGVLVARFLALRDELSSTTDLELDGHREVVARVLDHHAMMLSAGLDLLAVDWRSDRSAQQLERIEGLGAPAQWLRTVATELSEDAAPAPFPDPGHPA
jgi:hypothetical protein